VIVAAVVTLAAEPSAERVLA